MCLKQDLFMYLAVSRKEVGTAQDYIFDEKDFYFFALDASIGKQ